MSAAATRARRLAAPDGVARLLASARSDGRPVSLAEHEATYGPLTVGRALVETVELSGLRGRGGGSFPTGQKLRAVTAHRGRPVVVVNAAEAEPASKKDKALLHHVPHLVLDGAVAVAGELGAEEVVIALGGRTRGERAVLAAAIAERKDRLRWRLAHVPAGFVVGEETALIAALAGRAPKPTTKPPYPFESGLGGAPTLVQNAETLAHLALIARFGPAWFRSIGTEADPGTALVTLSGAVARPGVYEIELGTLLSELVTQAGGTTEPAEAFLVGGYFGAWTRDPHHRLTSANGLGAGVIIVLPSGSCALRESARVARYLADESAGQCGPCVHGLRALAGGLEELAYGRAGDRSSQLARWTSEVVGRGACRHPDGAARFITSTLSVFEDEVDLHLRHGSCGGTDRGTLPVGSAV